MVGVSNWKLMELFAKVCRWQNQLAIAASEHGIGLIVPRCKSLATLSPSLPGIVAG